ncbi:MAG: DUF2079 domain-containing protein, partial [Candidatus Latescibacteria bacterium]|nr:DUF2079 domain-containing protein [Candidatus Latescibacterota bacterium]
MSPAALLRFLKSGRCAISHAILLTTSFFAGLGVLGIHQYQTLTLDDLFNPSIQWIGYWIACASVWYTSWLIWNISLSRFLKSDTESALRGDAVGYVPLALILGVWIKHMGLPASLFVIPAVAGFLAWKLRSVLTVLGSSLATNARCTIVLGAGMTVFACAFSYYGALRFLAFRSFADFGLFVQQVWNFSNFDYFFRSGMGWLPFGNHFSPIILLLAPFYWIWENPITIILIQNVVLALGALPLYWLARDRYHLPIYGLAIGLCYLMYPALQLPAMGDFHESLLVATPVLFAFYYLQRKSYHSAWGFILLVLMCKEDTPFIVFMLGAYALVIQKDHRQGLSIMGGAVLWFVVSVGVIMPMSQGTENWYLQFLPSTGAGGTDAVTMMDRARSLVAHVFSAEHFVPLMQLLVPLGALSLLAPAEILIGVPTFLELALYTGPPFGLVGTLKTWHVVALVPAFFIATVFAIGKVSRSRFFSALQDNRTPGFLCLTYLLICGVGATLSYGAFPLLPRSSSDIDVTTHDRIGHEVVATIPPDVSVATTSPLSAHLAHRRELYMLP